MSHTPRPWVCRHWDGNQQIVIESVHHRGPNELALVRPPLTATPHDGWTCTEENVAENEANARLIAAAPELLAACKLSLKNVLCDTSAISTWRDMLRDAIAKADFDPNKK